jgi:hypothetical protein
MGKPLTKEAFLEGNLFYRADDAEQSIAVKIGRFFKLRTDENQKPSHIVALQSRIFDEWRHEANVMSITDDSVILYTSICGHSVDKKIYFHEYNLVEEEPADGTN